MTSLEVTVARLAVEYWKLLRTLNRAITSVPEEARERFASQAGYAAAQLEIILKEQNTSIETFDGLDFEVNLPASPVNGDEFKDTNAIVERTIEPAVIRDMRVVLPGKVLLAERI